MISTKFFHECDPFLDGATKRDIGVTGHSDSCVDPYYLVHRAEELGYHPQVILAGRAINDSMPAHVAGMMIRGLAYKENVADIRESPAGGIVEGLSDFGIEVYGSIFSQKIE